MADSAGKRHREAKKRQQREQKAQRKQLRQAGLLGNDSVSSGLFAPGELGREVIPSTEPAPAPAPAPAPTPPPQ